MPETPTPDEREREKACLSVHIQAVEKFLFHNSVFVLKLYENVNSRCCHLLQITSSPEPSC